ncbi:MAG: CRTAC1 family protein [Bacteroidia bacterium]|nr:CRTAC1 family protein [Bacteroidia bacterium]
MNKNAQHGWQGWIGLGIGLLAAACQDPAAVPRFEALPASRTGIAFENRLQDTEVFNILNYLYYYNGGGAAAGDIDNDGLPDLFFTSNLGPSRLYRNKGNFEFEDITDAAGIGPNPGWCSGASMADVNGDGWIDLYISVLDGFLDKRGHNLLYLNNGDLTFREAASEWNLDLAGYGVQGYFFDYDLDQDLDLFQLNHSVAPSATVGDTSRRWRLDPRAGDRLMRNDGGRFTDVTLPAGIYAGSLGYGLSASIADFNADGWPDLYVCNDFHEDDYLYLNQQDGRFAEQARSWLGHTSRFSMGSDAADIDGNGLPDLITLDMKPADEQVLKTAEAPESYQLFQFKLSKGYRHQYPRNMLQLNQSGGRFMEIGQLAGVSATDWSWSALWADFDLSGSQDLFITNGILRRPNDMDYIKFLSDPKVAQELNGKPDARQLRFIGEMPAIAQPNALFPNVYEAVQAGKPAASESAAWGLGTPGFSNGAVYADLDNDGDWDLAVNNLNAPASVYRNHTMERDARPVLRIRFEGPPGNRAGIGARAEVWEQGRRQTAELYPARGFLSSVDPRLRIALRGPQADSLRITWPGGASQLIRNPDASREWAFRHEDAQKPDGQGNKPEAAALAWIRADSASGLDWAHREDPVTDLQREPLMPHSLSVSGPRMGTGDFNGDGLDDLLIAHAAGGAWGYFWQTADGRFAAAPADYLPADAELEITGLAILDADLDGDLDLYAAAGGNQAPEGDERLRDRLYVNDGAGCFEYQPDALPDLRMQTGCAAAGDADGDGDPDIFAGGRSVAGAYGLSPRSALLINEGGRFRDASGEWAPALQQAGMVSDARWADLDGDGAQELVLAGEWMPVQIFRRGSSGLQPDAWQGRVGWWNRLGTVRRAGRTHLIAGNLGRNSFFQASPEAPVRLYAADFDGNGFTDPLLTYVRGGREYPAAARDELLTQLPALRKRFPRYADYADADIRELAGADALGQALVRRAEGFSSQLIRPSGPAFEAEDLPWPLQASQIHAIAAWDPQGNGEEEALIAGNFGAVGPARGRYDAFTGIWTLRTDGSLAAPEQSGLLAEGEIRDLALIRRPDGRYWLIAARNNAAPAVFYSASPAKRADSPQ